MGSQIVECDLVAELNWTEHTPAHQSKTQVPPQPVPPIRKLAQASYSQLPEDRQKKQELQSQNLTELISQSQKANQNGKQNKTTKKKNPKNTKIISQDKEQDKSQERQLNEMEMTTFQKCPNVGVKSSAVEPGRVDIADEGNLLENVTFSWGDKANPHYGGLLLYWKSIDLNVKLIWKHLQRNTQNNV